MDDAPDKYFSYGEALDTYVEQAALPDLGIGTGYSLDEECGRMSTGELALLWARSGAGKSSLLLNIIANTPTVPTVFFNMEMRARTMAEWLTTMMFDLGVGFRLLKEVILNGDEDPRYYDVMERLEAAKAVEPPMVWFVEPRGPTVDDLARTVDTLTVETGIRPVRVMVDHLQLMRGARDYEGTCTTGEAFHQWAQDDELAVIVAQQTGRGGGGAGERNDGHMPVTMSSGLYGGESDADWVLGAWRPERDPRFKKTRGEFKKDGEYEAMLSDKRRVEGLTHFAVVKNRPFGTLLENGISLWWDTRTRQLEER